MDHFNFSFILTYVYTKTLVLLLLCVVTFRDQPQGSQSCPAFTKTGIVQKNTCTMHFASDTSIIRTEIYFCTCQPNPPPSPSQPQPVCVRCSYSFLLPAPPTFGSRKHTSVTYYANAWPPAARMIIWLRAACSSFSVLHTFRVSLFFMER